MQKKLNQGHLSVTVPFINVITLTFYCAITVCTLLPMCPFNKWYKKEKTGAAAAAAATADKQQLRVIKHLVVAIPQSHIEIV